jgi:hypothetical protein
MPWGSTVRPTPGPWISGTRPSPARLPPKTCTAPSRSSARAKAVRWSPMGARQRRAPRNGRLSTGHQLPAGLEKSRDPERADRSLASSAWSRPTFSQAFDGVEGRQAPVRVDDLRAVAARVDSPSGNRRTRPTRRREAGARRRRSPRARRGARRTSGQATVADLRAPRRRRVRHGHPSASRLPSRAVRLEHRQRERRRQRRA